MSLVPVCPGIHGFPMGDRYEKRLLMDMIHGGKYIPPKALISAKKASRLIRYAMDYANFEGFLNCKIKGDIVDRVNEVFSKSRYKISYLMKSAAYLIEKKHNYPLLNLRAKVNPENRREIIAIYVDCYSLWTLPN